MVLLLKSCTSISTPLPLDQLKGVLRLSSVKEILASTWRVHDSTKGDNVKYSPGFSRLSLEPAHGTSSPRLPRKLGSCSSGLAFEEPQP